MYPEKKGGSHKMARSQQNWSLLTLLTRWAQVFELCQILLHPNLSLPVEGPFTPPWEPPQKTAPGGGGGGGTQFPGTQLSIINFSFRIRLKFAWLVIHRRLVIQKQYLHDQTLIVQVLLLFYPSFNANYLLEIGGQPGKNRNNTSTIRLWSCKREREI